MPPADGTGRRTSSVVGRWHRRLGISAATVLVLVVITGILLNHTSEFRLGSRAVKVNWITSLYGMTPPPVISFALGDRWLSGDTLGDIYFDGHPVANCEGEFRGAEPQGALIIAACSRELVLLSARGELIERIQVAHGLPVPVSKIGGCAGALCIQHEDRNYAADLDNLTWKVTKAAVRWAPETIAPAAISDEVRRSQLGEGLVWERVILDLHSGRIAGTVGVWLVDLVALALLFLALSGIILWLQRREQRRSS